MEALRFDISFGEHGISIDYHFCREWTEDGGCYGTNPNHGYTWDEVRKMAADYYHNLSERWEKMSYEEWAP